MPHLQLKRYFRDRAKPEQFTQVKEVESMPLVVISSGMTGPDGREDKLTEYLCDSPGCPNIASHVLGCVRDIRTAVVVCDEHAIATTPNLPLW